MGAILRGMVMAVGWPPGWLQRRKAHRAAESVLGFRDAVRNGEIDAASRRDAAADRRP